MLTSVGLLDQRLVLWLQEVPHSALIATNSPPVSMLSAFWFFLLQQTPERIDPNQLSQTPERVEQGNQALEAVQTGASGALGGISLPLLLGGIICFALGIALGVMAQRFFHNRFKKKNKPRWPRDWPKKKEIFTSDPDPAKPGYLSYSPQEAIGTGAMPLGRTYPRLRLFPDTYPLRGLRRWVEYLTSKPVWIPYKKRFQHLGVLGATGKGKSTSYAIPALAYGAFEENTAYFSIDVKSPQFQRMFAHLYKKAGKSVFFFDPWSLDETLAFEPLWRAHDEKKDIIAEVINTYSTSGGDMQTSENSEFFKVASNRLLRGILELAQYWPRQYCNLPCVQQLVSAGGNAIAEAFEKSDELMPSLDELLAAVEKIVEADDEDLEEPRSDIMNGALAILNRSGYRLNFVVKRMRRIKERYENDEINDQQYQSADKAFWAQVKHEWLQRQEDLERLMNKQGEFIQAPEDTRNSIVSTLSNKVEWFRDPNIAKAFSRDELNIQALIDRPCLFLIGAPMAKLKVGSLFVASIISNLSINAVYQRGMALEKSDREVSSHGIFFMLDEFPQLQISDAPSHLATFRGFKAGLVMIYQERGQLRKLYGDDLSTMEGNMVHKILLQGAHEDTAEFYAEKAIGHAQVEVESKSGVRGEKQSISRSIEEKPLMTTTDVRDMRLNGDRKPQLALSVGSDVPPFPLRPIPFYEDPTLRKMLGLERELIKTGPSGQETWKWWHWNEYWNPQTESDPYLSRRKMKSPAQREEDVDDPVHRRAQDEYTQLLDYLLNRRNVFDELQVPQLKLPDIGVTENDPRGSAVSQAQQSSFGGGPPGMNDGPEVPVSMLVPVYGQDVRNLINDDFQDLSPIKESEGEGGTLANRLGVDLGMASGPGGFEEEF